MKYFIITFTEYEQGVVYQRDTLEEALKVFDECEYWSKPIIIQGELVKGDIKYLLGD